MPVNSATPVLSVQGKQFLLDGQPFKMWGLRVANHLEDDAHVDELIGCLDCYCEHGVNTISPFLQGASGGTLNAFAPDGTLDEAVWTRTERLLDACAKRNMVVILGVFYKTKAVAFESREAVEHALREVTRRLVPHRHVLLNVVNEYHIKVWERMAYPFRDPQAVCRLIDLVHEIDPQRITGANAKTPQLILPVARHANVALHDCPIYSEALLFEDNINKPVVDVECGGHALDMLRHGVFSEGAKLYYEQQVASARAIEGKNILFHCHWVQGPPDARPGLWNVYRRRCDLGGHGTEADPGIHWFFDLVAAATGRGEHYSTVAGLQG
jgi:hypothetical protein